MSTLIKFFIYLSLILTVIYISGCATAKQISDDTEEKSQILATALSKDRLNNIAPSETAVVNPNNAYTVVLYFVGEDGYLHPEQRIVDKTAGLAKETILALCSGPVSINYFPTIPQTARLVSIKIQDKLCTVDFSSELVSRHSGGSSSEIATVYSIVNTLTQFSSVERVQILIEGEIVESIAGHLDISSPLEREGNYIKTNPVSHLIQRETG